MSRRRRRSIDGSRAGRIVVRERIGWGCCRGKGSSKAIGERKKKLPPGQGPGGGPPLLDCLRPSWPEHHFWAKEVGLSWAGETEAPRLAVGLTGVLQAYRQTSGSNRSRKTKQSGAQTFGGGRMSGPRSIDALAWDMSGWWFV